MFGISLKKKKVVKMEKSKYNPVSSIFSSVL